MISRFQTEVTLYNRGADWVVGVDEVGRGPLAGPVVAAAVLFKREARQKLVGQTWWKQITDSKKLSRKMRENLSEQIIANSAFAYGVATVAEIEKFNILQASLLAMRRAVKGLPLQNLLNNNVVLLIDGRYTIPNFEYQQKAFVGGDSLVHSIAAASIIAKVYRDNLMIELSQQYPEYSLEKHKGYGTKLHIEAIKKLGLSPIHRASFCNNFI